MSRQRSPPVGPKRSEITLNFRCLMTDLLNTRIGQSCSMVYLIFGGPDEHFTDLLQLSLDPCPAPAELCPHHLGAQSQGLVARVPGCAQLRAAQDDIGQPLGHLVSNPG